MYQHTPQDLFKLRSWYGVRAMFYSAVYLGLGVSFFFIPEYYYIYIFSTMLLISIVSHIHLWPAIKAAYVVQGEKERANLMFFIWLIFWLMPIFFFAFPDFLKHSGAGGKIAFLFFLGPPIFMLRNYNVHLAKDENHDQVK